MQKYQDAVIKSNGLPAAGVSVRVQSYPGAVDSTIYSDNGVTLATNPLTTDINGSFGFYAADGRYQLVVSGAGITSKTLADVLLEDPVDANLLSAVGISFPATQVLNAGANVLDDYEEGTWVPAISFDTPGNLAVSYSTQLGWYTKIGNKVTAWWNIVTSSFTWTTSSGNLRVITLPIPCSSDASCFMYGDVNWQGITKAGYTQINPRVTSADNQIYFIAAGSGQPVSAIAAADVPSAGTVILRGMLTYRT